MVTDSVKKGSITIFLALILSLILALVSTSIESVRMAAARTQILDSMDIGLYSLFAQYDRTLLEKYDLFSLYASGQDNLDMADVYDNFESYMKPVLKQNSQKLSLQQGGFSGYRLLTDENGEVFFGQAVNYMRETLGTQGVQLLIKRIEERKKKTEDSENQGEKAESGDTLDSYDSEMDSAAKESQEAEKNQTDQGGFDDGNSDFSGGVNTEVKNPIPVIKRIKKMGLLTLVIPAEKGISDKAVDRRNLVSGRKLQQGLNMDGAIQIDGSYTSDLLFGQYLITKLGSYKNPAKSGLEYQIEYIIGEKNNDKDNLKAVANRLFLIRQGVNFAAIAADGGKRIQIEALALAIASGFLIPPAAPVIEAALMLCWAFAESILDVRELFAGGRVPLIKTAADWQISLENLPGLLEGLDSARKDCKGGMSYEDYLQILLMTKSKSDKVKGGMDMIENTVRNMGKRKNFRMDHCITAVEASADVKANKRKIFTVTRQYAYE